MIEMKITDNMKRTALTENEGGSLEGMMCPKCGNYERLRIAITHTLSVDYEGIDGGEGYCDWGADSYCDCPECDFDGIVENFTITDAEIKRLGWS